VSPRAATWCRTDHPSRRRLNGSVSALAARAAAHDNPHTVALPLDFLRKAGAHEQATTLAARLPPVGMFGLFLEQNGPADRFRFGREADSTGRAMGLERPGLTVDARCRGCRCP
jgi:hypothetical protein